MKLIVYASLWSLLAAGVFVVLVLIAALAIVAQWPMLLLASVGAVAVLAFFVGVFGR